MSERRATVTMILLTTAPDGSLGIVVNFVIGGATTAFARADVESSWMVSLVDALGCGCLSFGEAVDYPCRVRLDDAGRVVELGRADGTYWFRTLEEIGRWPGSTRRGSRALAWLNDKRARANRRDLDPVAAGYIDSDIIADAVLEGWHG